LNRYEEAIASYDRVIAINPNSDDAWVGRGNALDDSGKPQEALAAYDRAIALNPNSEWAWYNRGVIPNPHI